MPPRKRATANDKKLVVGVVGLGEAPDAAIKAHFDDLAKAGDLKVVVMLTDPVTESTLSVLDWADDNAGGYDVVVSGPITTRDAKGVQRGAVTVLDGGDNPAGAFVEALAEYPRPETDVRIWALWDPEAGENDGFAYDVIELGTADGIKCYDLVQALEDITLSDGDTAAPVPPQEPEPLEDAEPTADPDPEPAVAEEEAPKRRRGRPRKSSAPEAVAEEESAAETEPVVAEVPITELATAAAVDGEIEVEAAAVAHVLAQFAEVFSEVVAAKVARLLQNQNEETPRAARSRARKAS